MEGKTKHNQFLKSSLTTLRQFQLFVFQASSPDEIMFFRPIKTKETGRSGASLLDTLYNVAKASTPPSTPRHQPARDLPDVVRRRAVEDSNVKFKIERPWKFCQVSNWAIFVFCNSEIYFLSYLTYSAHRLIGSRIIESATYCNKILLYTIIPEQYRKYVGLLNHSVIVITFMLILSDSINRRTLYYQISWLFFLNNFISVKREGVWTSVSTTKISRRRSRLNLRVAFILINENLGLYISFGFTDENNNLIHLKWLSYYEIPVFFIRPYKVKSIRSHLFFLLRMMIFFELILYRS